ncbi:UNVERIFIED_CONTAM: hypothetical protein GTU68_055658 [Idotea baltica]|nr:hypothetical protein [Idotea baltica]
MIPVIELIFAPRKENLTETQETLIKDSALYDGMIYLTVPLQWGFVGWFLWIIATAQLEVYEFIGLISAMGIMCGTFGINVGHELGHRFKKHERFLAKTSLLSSLYMHFYIEHNRGHHKNVSTEIDPASSRYGEIIYTFWFRSIIGGYLSAWKLEEDRLKRKKLPVMSLQNEMLRYQLIQIALLAGIYAAFGGWALFGFINAALVGILLLETVNYIEHYGLQRDQMESGNYERVMPHHSWNSDHVLGRLMLFELSRHSDHHYMASRKYQILRHHENAPQMPTGYPGMMVMALVPPVWFGVMHRRIEGLQEMVS